MSGGNAQVWQSGTVPQVSLTGDEHVPLDTGGSVFTHCTTQQIADLAAGSDLSTAITALNTVGAGTITAAGIAGAISKRGGSQANAAFTDTTATGAQLDAAMPTMAVGDSFVWTYQNTTNANATLQAGASGVTLSGITVVYSGTSAQFLVTKTAAATYTIVGFAQTAPTGSSGTFVANQTTPVTVADSRVTAGSAIVITLKTVGGTVGVSAPAIKTITAGTGFTVAALASDTSTYNYLILG